MAPAHEKSQKRGRQSASGRETETKKPRRSERIQKLAHEDHNGPKAGQLPSPLTHKDTTATEEYDGIITPPSQQLDIYNQQFSPGRAGLSSPPHDTQTYSQFIYPPRTIDYEVEDEDSEGVWGYIIPLDTRFGDPMVLRRRNACPVSKPSMKIKGKGRQRVSSKMYERQEEEYEKANVNDGIASGGYLIGRHPECDCVLPIPTISNRHCLIFNENKGGDSVAVLEDLSANGTFVNDTMVGRNKRRELVEGDEISILGEARFAFRYPRTRRDTNGFRHQYTIQEQLGKGHFASVYLCVEKSTGVRYAVKKFEKRSGPGERSKVEGLQQEIAVLMGVSHPNLLCLKDTFDEDDGVFLVLELAPEGELFNWIVMKQKLTEDEARHAFIQLFQAMKYLHERNIVHRDIKPENILLTDKNLSVKLADFGLAKIIGEESFTTTLCGTPSYVAPEILQSSNHRRYTRAVDIWSLGVVLYICLCGFPPFSDELYSPENPYTLSQQIQMGRFDYPSPYWDSVGDLALDLIDRMLEVDVDKRITVDECLEHPWVTQRELNPYDSTDGLTGAMGQLDFSRRKVQRERTLLSSINEVKISRVIDLQHDMPPVTVFEKNPQWVTQPPTRQVNVMSPKAKTKTKTKGGIPQKEQMPAANRSPREFMQMGGKGDQPLFGDDSASRYVPDKATLAKKKKAGKK